MQVGAPTNVRPGETTTLEIFLSNNNETAPINNVAFSNSLPGTLPNGLKVAGNPTYTCYDPATSGTSSGVGTLTTSLGAQAIGLSGGTIPQRHALSSTDGSCTILIPVTPGTSDGSATNYTYTILAGSVTGNDGGAVANAGDVSQSVNVVAIARPTLSKSFSSSTVVLGGATSTLTITVSNPNPVPIPDFSITDVFPILGGDAIIDVAGPVATTSSTCTGGGTPAGFGAISPGDTSITVSGGTIAANHSCTMTVVVAARHTNGAHTTGRQTNTIDAVSQFDNEIGIRAQSNAGAYIWVNSPLNVSKSFSPSALAHGQNGSMTITLYNMGDSSLTVQSFTDSPIDGIGNVDPSLGLKVNGPVSVTCTGLGSAGSFAATADLVGITQTANTSIAAGGSCSITTPIVGHTMADHTPITYTNRILAGAVNVGDPAIVSQYRSATILVADTLRVLKYRHTNYPRPGNPARYSIAVQNWSTSVMNDVRILDPLDNGTTFLTGTINGNNYNPSLSGDGCSGLTVSNGTGAGSADFVITTVPARSSVSSPGQCSVTFYGMIAVAAGDGASTVNSLPAGSVCTNNGAGFCNGIGSNSNNSPVDVDVLTAAKSFNPAGPLPEGTITRMTITLRNYSANPLTNVAISDTLPLSGSVQMQIADPAAAATTCGAGTITAIPGITSVALNGGQVPARANLGAGDPGTCTLQVDVVGPAGVYSNTATAAGNETYANGSPGPVKQANANANITYTSVLSAAKTFSPGTISSGGLSRVTVRLNNSGPVELTNVSVTDPLPAGMLLANSPNAYTTCNGPVAITATPGGGSISMTGASIAGSGNCDLLFDVIASGAGDWVNSIPSGNIEAVGTGVINQSAVTGTLLFSSGAGLTVAKVTNPSTLTFPGEVSRLTIVVTNGSQAVTGLELTDYFTLGGSAGAAPNGMVLTANPQAATTCQGGAVSALPDSTWVTLSGASLNANASCTISVNVTSTTTGGITNYIPAGAISTHQGLTNAGQATTSLSTQTNLGATKQFTPNVIKPGERSRLRITFFNPTAQVASSLSVLDTMPASVTVPPGANPTTTCTGAAVTSPAANQVLVSGGILGAASGTAAASCYAEIDVVAASEGIYENIIPIGALSGIIGGIPSTNSQPANATLLAKSPILIHKAIGGFTLDAGNPGGFTTGTATRAQGLSAPLVIRLENPNSTDLTQAGFTDALPSGLVVATTPAAATTCANGTVTATPSATSIALAGGTIPASGFCTVTVNVLSNIPGTYVNNIPTAAVTTFQGIKNEEATSAEIIVSFPPTVGKQFAPAVVPVNGTSRLTLVLGNENSGPITLTSMFTDTLPTSPGAMRLATPPNVDNGCTGAITAAAGSGSISLANGATIPVGGCRISVDVTAATPGTHTNTVPAGALTTSLGASQQPANAPLVVSTLGFISGKVFKDNDVTPNGIFDPGSDEPLAGVTINLHNAADCSGAPQTITTDAQGNYLFHGLAPGPYSVCQPGQPTGTRNGITTAGSITSVQGSTGTAGNASNPTGTTSQVIGIVLNDDGSGSEVSGSTDNNFAEVVLSSISGTLFLDYNNNGLLNGPDTGIAGQTIQLLDSGNAVVGTATTDVDGNYSFTGLQPGTYSVRQPNQPTDTTNGKTVPGTVGNGGSAGTATPVSTVPSQISGIVLPANTASPDNDFAELPNSRTLSGMVFFDFDDSGTIDGPDYGIDGQTIDLTGSDLNGSPVTRQATTQPNGGYVFNNLPEGTYTVTQPNQPANSMNGQTLVGSTGGSATDPATTPSIISNINLIGANTVSGDNDFAEIPEAAPDLAVAKTHAPASFGEGSSTGYFVITPRNIGTTDTAGGISISDTLPAGMTVAARATGTGWMCSGAVGATTVNCTSTDVIPASGTGNPITLRVAVGAGLSGQVLTNTAVISGGGEPPGFTGNNGDDDTVAITAVAQVSGTVWFDVNHDRIPDGDESRLPGWQVELLFGGVLVGSTTTGDDGTYTLRNLAPGDGYQVRFRHPESGLLWGYAATNEQGIAPNQGARDDPANPVNTNTGNPAGASTLNGVLDGLTLFAGDNIVEQSLPVDPNGVVYDSLLRQPLAGATVTLDPRNCLAPFDPALHLVGGAGNMSQVTVADGFYSFMFTAVAPQCDYTLVVTQPAGYYPPPSNMIPPTAGPLAVPLGPGITQVQIQPTPPIGNEDTTYYFGFTMSGASQNVVNNHIPLDRGVGSKSIPTLSEWALILLSLLMATMGGGVLRKR